MFYVGVDGCKAGWFTIRVMDETCWEVDIFQDISSLWNNLRDAELILIDIPIGLRDRGNKERICDTEARKLLGTKRGSSVFPFPCRDAVYADIREASIINAKITNRKLSQQVLSILRKIKQVDQLLSADMTAQSRIREVHPEVCFQALNGGKAMTFSKKKLEGYLERMAVLSSVFNYTEDLVDCAERRFLRRDLARDDILDAMVAAVTAFRQKQGLSTIPENPEVDSTGLPMEMVYYLTT